MSIKDAIDIDIEQFLKKVDELDLEDRRLLLRSIFNKHFYIYLSSLNLDRIDFLDIKNFASMAMAKETPPQTLSNHPMDQSDVRILRIIEATIQLLNNKDALKRLPKFESK